MWQGIRIVKQQKSIYAKVSNKHLKSLPLVWDMEEELEILAKARTILEEFCISFDDSLKREKVTTYTVDVKYQDELDRLFEIIGYFPKYSQCSHSDFINYFLPYFNYPVRIDISKIDSNLITKSFWANNPFYYIKFTKEDLELWKSL